MAASDPHQHSDRVSPDEDALSAAGELAGRLHEEIARAERHGTGVSCLLVAFENLERLTREHGEDLREQTIDYVAGALRGELRCFDRVGRTRDGEVILLLPGADSPRGEIVARRALQRLRTIKVESAGARVPLQVSVGLAAWRDGLTAQTLLAQARAALESVNGDQPPNPASAPAPPPAPMPTDRSREPDSSRATPGRMGGQ
jgi:diguanylate cyclase (GGDEF)-like protein